MTAPAIDVQPGHRIKSSTLLDDSSPSMSDWTWTVQGINEDTGKDSTLRIAYSRAGSTDYDNAMLVNENVVR